MDFSDKWEHETLTGTDDEDELMVDFDDPERTDPAGAAAFFKALVSVEKSSRTPGRWT